MNDRKETKASHVNLMIIPQTKTSPASVTLHKFGEGTYSYYQP